MKVDDPIRPSGRDEYAYRIAHLIAGYIKESLTQAEHQELDDWVTASDENQLLFEELTDESQVLQWLKWKEELPLPLALRKARQRSSQYNNSSTSRLPAVADWRRFILVSMALLFIVLLYFVVQTSQNKNSPVPQAEKEQVLLPGRWHASLRLADGRLVELDSLRSGTISSDQTGGVVKNDSGELVYETRTTHAAQSDVEYHVLFVSAGSWYRLRLADGTRVWLNAGSQLKYPVAFDASQRVVELAGEAWFEVAPDEQWPFVVNCGQTNVQVLGTSFNIQDYAGDKDLTISLATGKLRINASQTLVAGEQARINEKGEVVTAPADIEAALGWKSGLFVFKQTPIDEVMQSLARWYGAEIVYEARPPVHFRATIPRSAGLLTVLHLLEATNEIHFRVEGRKIIVMK